MGSNGQKNLAFFNMLFIRADFCRPLRFINTAILFIFLSFWHIVHIVVALLFCPDILMIIYEEYEIASWRNALFYCRIYCLLIILGWIHTLQIRLSVRSYALGLRSKVTITIHTGLKTYIYADHATSVTDFKKEGKARVWGTDKRTKGVRERGAWHLKI